MKFGMEAYALGLLWHAKFDLIGQEKMDIRVPKIAKIGQIFTFLPRMGRHYRRIKVKFGMAQYTIGPLSCANFAKFVHDR